MSSHVLAYYISEAERIKRTFGRSRAAGYLRNRGVPVTIAVVVLARHEIVVR